MNASFALDDPQRQALETISFIAQKALNRIGGTEAIHRLFALETSENRESLSRAKALYAARRRRDRVFTAHADLLAEPAWDILLDLFIAYHEKRTVAVSSACLAACVPPTTGLRWLATLQRRNLVERVPDYDDRRRQFVQLSNEALALVEHALT